MVRVVVVVVVVVLGVSKLSFLEPHTCTHITHDLAYTAIS